MDDVAAERMPISELRELFYEELFYEENRSAAEYAFALAVRLREVGETWEARKFAVQCLELTKALPSSTLDDVSSSRSHVGGVPLPERFHDGVVRTRLADLLS